MHHRKTDKAYCCCANLIKSVIILLVGRQKEQAARRVLDHASRQRRLRKAIEALEQDNYQDDPHADLKMSKKAPKFEESMDLPPCKWYITKDVYGVHNKLNGE